MVNWIFIIVGAIYTYILFPQVTLSDNAGILQYFSGTLTKIVCLTTTPSFLINGIYSSQHYDQLPGLFGIEANVAPDRSNVTLLINGNIVANNVTVECQDFIDHVRGTTKTLFQYILQYNNTFPAPHHVRYDHESGILKWKPPLPKEKLVDQNINITSRITHYIIYVTDLQTGLTKHFTTKGLETSIEVFDIIPDIPCHMSIQVSAVNPAGEGQRSTNITDNNCSSVTTSQGISDTEKDNQAENFALLYYVAAVMVIVALLVVFTVAFIMTLCFLAKNRNISKPTKFEVINKECPQETSKRRLTSEVPDASENLQTDGCLVAPSSSPTAIPIKGNGGHMLCCN